MPRFLFSPAVTDISRINIIENGKKSAGYGSRRQGPHSLSASAKHSSCQNIAVRLILGAEELDEVSGALRREATGFWSRASCTSYPDRLSVPSSNSGAHTFVLGTTSQHEPHVRLQRPHEFQQWLRGSTEESAGSDEEREETYFFSDITVKGIS